MTPSTFGRHCLQAFMQAVPARCAVFYLIDATLEARDFLLQGMHAPMQMAAATLPDVPADEPPQLTARERQIALLLRDGASNKLLARQLGIGLPTVKTHLLNLFRKVGARNRTELVARLFL